MYKLGFPGQQYCVNDGLHPSQVYQGLCGEWRCGPGRATPPPPPCLPVWWWWWWLLFGWNVMFVLFCLTVVWLPSSLLFQIVTPWASPGPAATPTSTTPTHLCLTASPVDTPWCHPRHPPPTTTTWPCLPHNPWCPPVSTWTPMTTMTSCGHQTSWWRASTSPSWDSWRYSVHGRYSTASQDSAAVRLCCRCAAHVCAAAAAVPQMCRQSGECILAVPWGGSACPAVRPLRQPWRSGQYGEALLSSRR